MNSATLPARYSIRNGSKGRYLDDGSNFVQWLTDGDDAMALAWDDLARRIAMRNAYATAQAEGMQTNPEGWAHTGCDHANDYCQA